jgi:hypothetical protein
MKRITLAVVLVSVLIFGYGERLWHRNDVKVEKLGEQAARSRLRTPG